MLFKTTFVLTIHCSNEFDYLRKNIGIKYVLQLILCATSLRRPVGNTEASRPKVDLVRLVLLLCGESECHCIARRPARLDHKCSLRKTKI